MADEEYDDDFIDGLDLSTPFRAGGVLEAPGIRGAVAGKRLREQFSELFRDTLVSMFLVGGVKERKIRKRAGIRVIRF